MEHEYPKTALLFYLEEILNRRSLTLQEVAKAVGESEELILSIRKGKYVAHLDLRRKLLMLYYSTYK